MYFCQVVLILNIIKRHLNSNKVIYGPNYMDFISGNLDAMQFETNFVY